MNHGSSIDRHPETIRMPRVRLANGVLYGGGRRIFKGGKRLGHPKKPV